MKFIKNNALLILLGLLAILAFTDCKKKTVKPTEPIIEEPAPKGVMEGKYKWYAGDSATADLILTTYLVDCMQCSPIHTDVYTYNLFIPQYNLQSNYITYPYLTKKDTLIYYTQNMKIFKYARY